MNFTNGFVYLISGLVIITVVDTLGSIASRRLNFKYIYLIPLSLVIYIGLGYWVCRDYGLYTGCLVNGLLGLFDGTVGAWLSIALKANTGLSEEKKTQLSKGKAAGFMMIFAVIMALLGYLISTF